MSDTPSDLRCSKCSLPQRADAAVCAECGGSLLKVCGPCGFPNSTAKNFCDQCGEPLDRGAAAASPPRIPAMDAERAAPPIPEREIPNTGIVRTGTTAPPSNSVAPAPRKHSPHSDRFRNITPALGKTATPTSKSPEERTLRRPPGPAERTTVRRERRVSALSLSLGALFLASGLVIFGVRWRKNSNPEADLLRAADRYLSALRSGDLDAAYGLLSSSARQNCSREEYGRLRETMPWEYSDLKILTHEGNAAILGCRFIARGRPPEQIFLSFAREEDRWTRPFVWSLFNKIEDSLERNDAELAYRQAKAAVLVDPREPLGQAYVCEAAHDKGSAPEEVASACRAAIALAFKYPSVMTLRTRVHLYSILGNVLKNTLKLHPEAVQTYDAALATPGLGFPDQCDFLLARGDARASLADYPNALKDFRAADGACAEPDDRTFLRRALRVLGGAAGTEAVSLVEHYRQVEGGPTLLEWRKDAQARLARRRIKPPPERWHAEYLGGPRYKVKILVEQTPLLTADVDLWTDTVTQVRAQTP